MKTGIIKNWWEARTNTEWWEEYKKQFSQEVQECLNEAGFTCLQDIIIESASTMRDVCLKWDLKAIKSEEGLGYYDSELSCCVYGTLKDCGLADDEEMAHIIETAADLCNWETLLKKEGLKRKKKSA